MEGNWFVMRVDYKDAGQGNQVVVTNLHWAYEAKQLKLDPPTDDGEDLYWRRRYVGATKDRQNRVYTKPALDAVPDHVRIQWIQTAIVDNMGEGDLTPEEIETQVQAELAALIAEKEG